MPERSLSPRVSMSAFEAYYDSKTLWPAVSLERLQR